MGNKGSRRSLSESDDLGQRRRRKPVRSQSASQVDGRNNRTSLPDLGGAVPYRPREEPDVDVKLYRSYGDLARPKPGTFGDSQPEIKIYRRSTDGVQKYASLPRHFGRSKSAVGVPNGTLPDYPELRRRKPPYDQDYSESITRKRSPPESESGSVRESQRTSKRISSASSINSISRAPVSAEDFPNTAEKKRKLKCFEDQFCRSLADKYAGLADTLQLSALPIALAREQDGRYHRVSLLDYLDTREVPLDLLSLDGGEFIMLIPEALFHGIMHVRRDKISDLELWTNLARDIVTCIGVEAANELSRIFEYQIVLLAGNSAIRVLADHAAACVIEYIKKYNSYLDRNSAIIGVVKGYPPEALTGAPRYLSVILGNRELKWEVQETFKRPGMRKDLLLITGDLDSPDSLYSPWHFYTSSECNIQIYGYRGLLVEWDWIQKVYNVNAEDEGRFSEDISDSADYPDNIHRLYTPYKRLFGAEVMAKYIDLKVKNKIDDSLAQFIIDSSGDATGCEDTQPVYRPLTAPPRKLNFGTANLDNVDLTRAQLRQADLSQATARNSKLLLTDIQGAKLNGMDGSSDQIKGADVSYAAVAESTVDQATLEGITAKHVVMRPKKKRVKARARTDVEAEEGVPNGQTESSPPDTLDVTPVTARPKKKKKKVPRTLAIETELNGHSPEDQQETSPTQELPPEDVMELVPPGTSFISDSQGNLLEIDQAAVINTEPKVVKKVRRVKSTGDPEMIEQKQQRIRERKKKAKKRLSQPIATTPTEPIPETAVFIQEQPPVATRPNGNTDQTQLFFTESQQFKEPIHVVTTERLRREPEVHRVQRSSVNGSDGSGRSATDNNILDVTDTSVVVPPEEPVKPSKTKLKKSKSKSDKGKDSEKTKSDEKKRKKSKSKSPEKEVPEASNQAQSSPDSAASAPAGGTYKDYRRKARPTSTIPSSFADPSLSQKSPGKALSTTNIHQQHSLSIYPDNQAAGNKESGLYPRMTKSLSHHGTLGTGSKLHNLSFDSHGLGLRTARQIYGMSKEEIEFITRSQIFNMIKGLQIENIESNLPEVHSLFTGRDHERDDVADMVSSAGRIVTITGCYGNGKSALATAVGHEARKKFVVPMLVDARGCSSAVSVAHRMVHTFGLNFTPNELNMFYNWLNCHEQRLLFIVDNLDISAEEDTQLSDLFDDIITNVSNSRILCSSWRHFYKGKLTHEVYRLGNIQNSSLDTLRSLLPDLHQEGLESLVAASGHNPYIIRLLSKVFAMDDVDAGRFFEELTVSQTHALLDQVDVVLSQRTEDEVELETLRRLACCLLVILDNIPISYAELLLNASHFTSSFDAKSLAVVTERKDVDEVESSLNEMCEIGLVLCGGDRYMLPSLVKMVNISKRSSDGTDTLEYYKWTVEQVKLVCAKYHSKQCIEAVKLFRDNFDNYFDVLSKVIEREDTYELCPSFASLEYALFMGENLPDGVFMDFYESLAQQSEEKRDVAKQCRSLCCLSHKLVLEKKLSAAKQSVDKAYSLVQEFGEHVSETERAFCLRCIGKITWEEKDDRSRALMLVKKALDLYKISLGSRDLQTIYTNELYAWMLTKKESHQTARHFYNISDLFIKEMMEDHPLLIDAYDCRRNIWDRLCLFQRATDTAKKAVDVSKMFLGDHPVTAKMYTSLCEAIIKRGSLNDAISAGIDALSIRSKVLGDHIDTGQSYKTLAYLMLRSGQYDEAVRFGQSALEVYDKVDASETLKIDVNNVIAQARKRLEYKSHVYVELQSRDASKKNLYNGVEEPKKKIRASVPSVSTDV